LVKTGSEKSEGIEYRKKDPQKCAGLTVIVKPAEINEEVRELYGLYWSISTLSLRIGVKIICMKRVR
jgi:hypothetical protein